MIIKGKNHRGLHEIETEDAIYYESDNNYVYLINDSGKFQVDYKLAGLNEGVLSSKFIRISKSHIINITMVVGVSQQWNSRIKLKLLGCGSLYVNRTYLKDFKEYIMKGGLKDVD